MIDRALKVRKGKSMVKRYDWLASMINTYQYKIGVEIGAATGNTTERVLANCKSIHTLYVVDDWRPVPGGGLKWDNDGMEEAFRKKFVDDSRLIVLKGVSWKMAHHVGDHSLDFAFIDASHDKESVVKDIRAWRNKVRPGGLLCGHDLHFIGVLNALRQELPHYEEAKVDNMWFVMVA